MAFASRSSSILRSTLARLYGHQQPSTSSPALLNAVRLMSSAPTSKLFVGGLSWGTDEAALRDAFASFGEVIEAKVIMDRETGRSKGFGFVSFTSVSDAEAAMQSMDGRDLGGRTLRVNFAIEKPPTARRFGGDGGFGFGGPRGDSSFGGSSYGDSSFGGGNFSSRPRDSSVDNDSFPSIGSNFASLDKDTDSFPSIGSNFAKLDKDTTDIDIDPFASVRGKDPFSEEDFPRAKGAFSKDTFKDTFGMEPFSKDSFGTDPIGYKDPSGKDDFDAPEQGFAQSR